MGKIAIPRTNAGSLILSMRRLPGCSLTGAQAGITTDGRRVHLPVGQTGLTDVSLLELLRSLPGLDGLLGLITGSRRENGGTRRNER